MSKQAGWRNKLYESMVSERFKGFRTTGELSWFFKRGLVAELVEAERAAHTKLSTPIISVCAYNAQALNEGDDPARLYNELVRAHGMVLFVVAEQRLEQIQIRTR